VACLGLIAALLAWPEREPEAPPAVAGASGVLAWPARGSLTGDEALLRASSAAWRLAGDRGQVPAPGDDITPLLLDDSTGGAVVLLRSRTDDGDVLVASGVSSGDDVRLIDVRRVTESPPALVLPAGEGVRLLAAPPPAVPELAVRRADGLWQRLEVPADGLTTSVRGIGGDPLVLGVVASAFGQRGLSATYQVSGGSVLPQPDRILLTSPRWGRSSAVTPEEYDAAAALAPLLPAGTSVAVLAATGMPGARAVLAEVSRPGARQPVPLFAVTDAGNVLTGPPPLVQGGLAVAVLPRRDGRTLVLTGSGPSVARVEVRDATGRTLVEGQGGASVVVPAPAPSSLVVRGTTPDGVLVTRLLVASSQARGDTGRSSDSGGDVASDASDAEG
jgi:hypothetical protein